MDVKEIATLRAYYLKYNPENVSNVDKIALKFGNRKDELCRKLAKKYGIAPDLSSQSIKPVARYKENYQIQRPLRGVDGPLDIRSPEFDPSLALQQETLPNLSMQVRVLDNVSKCRVLLPPSDPHALTLAPKQYEEFQPIPQTQRTKEKDSVVLTTLADTYITGPFTVLRKCFLEHRRVRVVIRRVNSIRGVCSGLLKAFDKHMNLCLQDVTEDYLPLAYHEKLLLERERRNYGRTETNESSGPSVLFMRQNPHIKAFRKRYYKQMLVRGDNIVMIVPLQ